MAKKKKQSKKKPTFAPPLSKTDKLIYKAGYLVIALLAMLLVVATIFLVEQIAFSDDSVMASNSRGFLLILPFMMYAIISAWIFWYNLHSSCKPIFGNPDIAYGKEPWLNFYPLFSKERKKRVLRPSALKFRKKMLSLWLGGFCACLILACLGLFGRVSLMQNGDITVYNSLNKEKETYSVMDISELEIGTDFRSGSRRRGSKRRTYYVKFTFVMNDESSFGFSIGNFRSSEDAFEGMLKMKTLVDSRKIVIEGKENLDKVIDDHNYTSEELALLYELFEVTEE